VRCGDFRRDLPGRELAIRYNGHNPEVMIVSRDGEVLCRFVVDESPNNTGMETIRWYGGEQADLLYSPAALFDGHGNKVVRFAELPPPTGGRMGWYHCFAADLCGDGREGVVLYDPYGDAVYVYASTSLDAQQLGNYRHTARQYNARLMD